MMRYPSVVVVALAVLGLPAAAGAAQVKAGDESREAFIGTYCVTCHNARMKAGQLVLDGLDTSRPGEHRDVWERVIRKLRIGAMPPMTARRPDADTRKAFVASLESALDTSAALRPDPGLPVLHRLNRTEYANVVRDLLAVTVDVKAALPPDDSGFGFDNIGDLLRVSPSLLERYMAAAERISRVAVGDPSLKPVVVTYGLPYLTLVQSERMSPDLPFGSRGGLSVAHTFPADGEYLFRVRVQRHSITSGANIRGLDDENAIDVRVDGERVKVFTLGSKAAAPTAGGSGGGQARDRQTTDDDLNVRVRVRAGARRVGVTLQKKTWYAEGVAPSQLPAASHGNTYGTRTTPEFGRVDMGIDRVEIEGPFGATVPVDAVSRRAIFVCEPKRPAEERSCAERILTRLTRRAFRRPVTAPDIAPILAFYEKGRADGDFNRGIQRGLERLLVSPEFLFRAERQQPGAKPGMAVNVSDLELASRLSFFLWGSIPDDALLNLAAAGRLRAPGILEQQVQRMLADPRSSAFINNFFGQWLFVRNVALAQPDPKAYPEFDDNLREAFQTETRMLIENMVREDRSAVDLLTADYTFLNERLARHYGIPGVYGSHFRRVSLPDERRRGVLGHGGTLTALAYAHRTSPVVRGKWLLENILGSPPPPPPANVPPFPEENGAGQPRTVREKMEQHRRNPVCAACHSVMDPLGFALENFDGIGKWRETDAGSPVDASGVLPSGSKFSGPADFRAALLREQDTFVQTMTSKLLTYAMGRGTEPFDMPAVRKIVRESQAKDYRWSALILSVVKSVPFQMRRSES
jgi:mono/diheme cytochrome c family protein